MSWTKPRTGAQYLLLSGVGLAIVNMGVKFVPRIPPHEILFFRALISLILTGWALRIAGISPWGKNKPMLIARGLAGTFGLWMYFYTLQVMPFASAVTIQYLHPILTGLVAGYFLRERPSLLQWWLFALSFVGVLMVRGFDARISGGALLVGMASAVLTSISFTLIRALRHEDHALVVMFYLPLVSLFILGPFSAMNWITPVGNEWWVILVIGVMTQLSQYWLTRAYQLDTAANISNLNYLGVIYALILGIIVFGEQVEGLGLLGMAVIVISAALSGRVRRPDPLRRKPH